MIDFRIRDEIFTEYNQVFGIYQFYWKVAMQVSAFYYVAIGGILSFYVTHLQYVELRWLLLFCTLISIGFSFLTLQGARSANDINKWTSHLASKIENAYEFYLSSTPLSSFLAMNGVISIIIGAFCIHFFLYSLWLVLAVVLLSSIGLFVDPIFEGIVKVRQIFLPYKGGLA